MTSFWHQLLLAQPFAFIFHELPQNHLQMRFSSFSLQLLQYGCLWHESFHWLIFKKFVCLHLPIVYPNCQLDDYTAVIVFLFQFQAIFHVLGDICSGCCIYSSYCCVWYSSNRILRNRVHRGSKYTYRNAWLKNLLITTFLTKFIIVVCRFFQTQHFQTNLSEISSVCPIKQFGLRSGQTICRHRWGKILILNKNLNQHTADNKR